MARNKTSRPAGFTLIELLIVVLIIAILAAIAVPNFLEFQMRAKVARLRADFRTIATAIEAYCVDMGDYPRNWIGGFQVLTLDLSTPIAYLGTSNIFDPFGKHMQAPHYHNYNIYGYHRILTLDDARRFPSDSPWRPDGTAIDAPGYNPGAIERYGPWLLHSLGPDRVWWAAPGDWRSHDLLYDPTNGTKSFGNLVRTQLDTEGRIADGAPY